LLDGKIEPLQPQHSYPVIVSETVTKVAAAAYANGFVPLPALGARTLVLANGTLDGRVVIELPDAPGRRRLRIWNCTGECVLDETRPFGAGVHSLPIPPAGTAVMSKI
jgi:hypothetical protein